MENVLAWVPVFMRCWFPKIDHYFFSSMKLNTVGNILFSIITAYFISCNSENSNEFNERAVIIKSENESGKVSYALFKNSDSSYGFNVILDGKIYIHQPVIPLRQGWKGFDTPDAASRMAEFLVARLERNYPHFMLTKILADSLLNFPGSNIPLDYNHDTGVLLKIAKAVVFPLPEDENIKNDHPLPTLPEPPIKAAWRSLGRAPFGKRNITSSFSIGDWVYIGAGEHNDMSTNDFWAYDTRTGSWTCLASIPETGRISGIGFSINGKGYIGLGALRAMASSSFNNDLHEYDPVLNSWTEKAPFPGKARIDASFFVVNGKGYAGLGFAGTPQQDFYEFDPVKNQWKRVHDFIGGPRSSAAGLSVFGKGFIVCGGGVKEETRTLFEYQPEIDRWIQRDDFPGKSRYHLNGNGIDSNLFMAGAGRAEGGAVNYRDYYLYNTQTGKWSGLPDYLIGPEGISRTGGGNVKGHIYAGTGYNGFFQDEWNVFEYYYTTGKDTGLYDEGVCYPMKYDGSWELYQECTGGNCYAGMAIKATEKLGDLCYSSMVQAEYNTVHEVKIQNRRVLFLPKSFWVSTEKNPARPYALRLFFSRESFENLVRAWNDSAGSELKTSQIRILISDTKISSQDTISDMTGSGKFQLITPTLYGYGYQQETWVAELPVTAKNSMLRMAVLLD